MMRVNTDSKALRYTIESMLCREREREGGSEIVCKHEARVAPLNALEKQESSVMNPILAVHISPTTTMSRRAALIQWRRTSCTALDEERSGPICVCERVQYMSWVWSLDVLFGSSAGWQRYEPWALRLTSDTL